MIFGRGKVSRTRLHKKKTFVRQVVVKFLVYEMRRCVANYGKLYKYFDNENKKVMIFVHLTDEKQKLD